MPSPPLAVANRRPLALACLALLAVPALSGCGGGGGSSVTNSTAITVSGYRIVPAGGPVIPLPDNSVVLNTPAGVVDQGVQVSAGTITASSLPAPPPGYTAVPGAAYQLTTDPVQPVLHSPITLNLRYPATAGTATAAKAPTDATAATYQIFTYYHAQNRWVLLPGSSVDTTNNVISAYMNGTGSVPGTNFPFDAALSTFSDSGLYAVFQSNVPAAPSVAASRRLPASTGPSLGIR